MALSSEEHEINTIKSRALLRYVINIVYIVPVNNPVGLTDNLPLCQFSINWNILSLFEIFKCRNGF